MTQLKAFFKDTAIYGLGAVLPKIINFSLTAVITAVFTTTQFSGQTQWFIYAGFINVLLTLGFETAFFRFFTKEKQKESIVSTSFITLIGTTSVFLVIGFLGAPQISNFMGFEDLTFFKILMLVTILDTWVVIPFALLRVTGRPLKFMWVKVINMLVYSFLVVLYLIVLPKIGHRLEFVSWDFSPKIIHLFYANLIASVITFMMLFGEIKKVGWNWNAAVARKLFNYGWPIMVGGLAYMINENLDKLIIPRLISEEANGVYAACYKLSVFMTLYVTAFRMGAEPFFFNQQGLLNATKKYSVIMTWFVVIGCVFILGVISFIDVFANIFLSQEVYKSGLFVVPILLMANLFSGIYNNLAIWYKLTDRTKMGMYISLFGAVITLFSLGLFLPLYGIIGGAWATLTTYILMTIISYSMGRKYYPVPYEVSKIVGFILVTSFLSFLSFYIFRGQYLFSLLFLIVLIIITYFVQIKPSNRIDF